MSVPPLPSALTHRENHRSAFGWGNEPCPHCYHELRKHFWWEAVAPYAQDTVGCEGCKSRVCNDRKAEKSMSGVNLCERCDSLMLGSAVATLEIAKTPGEPYERKELCPLCVGDFVAFMAQRPERDRQVIREPYAPPRKETRQVTLELPAGVYYTSEELEALKLQAGDEVQ